MTRLMIIIFPVGIAPLRNVGMMAFPSGRAIGPPEVNYSVRRRSGASTSPV